MPAPLLSRIVGRAEWTRQPSINFAFLQDLTLHAFYTRNTWEIQSVYTEARLPKPGYGEEGK